LSDNIKGVLFYSTPHYGSNIITIIFDIIALNLIKMKNIFETNSSELGLYKNEIHEKVSNIEFSNVTKEICFSGKDHFTNDHDKFKQIGIKYINLNETEKTNIFQGNLVDVVEYDSRFLPETENYFLDNKIKLIAFIKYLKVVKTCFH